LLETSIDIHFYSYFI